MEESIDPFDANGSWNCTFQSKGQAFPNKMLLEEGRWKLFAGSSAEVQIMFLSVAADHPDVSRLK